MPEWSTIPVWIAVIGSLAMAVGWLIRHWLAVAQATKIADERASHRRVSQESLDQAENAWREAATECSQGIEEFISSMDEGREELAVARDKVCRFFYVGVIPKYSQFVRRRILHYSGDKFHQVDIVHAATEELRHWQRLVRLLNDDWVLENTRQARLTISRHDLQDLRKEVNNISDETAPNDFFTQELRSLLTLASDNSV